MDFSKRGPQKSPKERLFQELLTVPDRMAKMDGWTLVSIKKRWWFGRNVESRTGRERMVPLTMFFAVRKLKPRLLFLDFAEITGRTSRFPLPGLKRIIWDPSGPLHPEKWLSR